jgi:hypothetical protein
MRGHTPRARTNGMPLPKSMPRCGTAKYGEDLARRPAPPRVPACRRLNQCRRLSDEARSDEEPINIGNGTEVTLAELARLNRECRRLQAISAW